MATNQLTPSYMYRLGGAAAAFAGTLVVNGTLNQVRNGSNISVREHKLSAAVVFTMFYNIIRPLVLVDYPTSLGRVDETTVDVFTQSMAFDSLLDTYGILYTKASRLSLGLIRAFHQYPTTCGHTFPSFVTALINSIGPLQTLDHGIHVPYLVFTEVQAQMPPTYTTNHLTMFMEAISQSRSFSIAAVDIMTFESSPWWTFHTYVDRVSGPMETYSLWSPFRFHLCDNALKLGTLFAKSRLTTSVGVISSSGTPFYKLGDSNQIVNWPPDAFIYPYFDESQPAHYRLFERLPASDNTVSQSSYPQSSTTGSHTSSANAVDPPLRMTYNDDVYEDRIVYLYFDHQVAVNVNARDLDLWSVSLNGT